MVIFELGSCVFVYLNELSGSAKLRERVAIRY